ncbi:MAG: hypothetical protein Q7S33_02920 [Nanoarchaeota archaeon]|nr:hypothetical protein [Nanoarchaeota archaeon]
MKKLTEKYKKAKTTLTNHLIDSTGLLIESTPIFAAIETNIAGMSDDVSINARLIAAGLTYFGGMGIIYSGGRDFYRKTFNITAKAKEGVQGLNDAVYTGLFNLVGSPIIYLISGSRDIGEIAIGTASATALGLVNGAPMGYVVDAFRDLTGLKECERPAYPNLLKRQSPKIKKGLATLLVAGSIALTIGVYTLSQDKPNLDYQQTTQQIIKK